MWLEERDVKFEYMELADGAPTEAELTEYYSNSGLPLKRFFNTSGKVYKELGLAKKLLEMSEAEQIEILSTDGMLVKRPLIVKDDRVLVGFKEEDWKAIF